MSHTPGPWHWEIQDASMAVLGGEDIMTDHVVSVGPCKSCQDGAEPPEWVWGRCTTPTVANARLIAAAPDLFDALKRALPKLENAARLMGNDEEVIADAFEFMRAALAKATGESK